MKSTQSINIVIFADKGVNPASIRDCIQFENVPYCSEWSIHGQSPCQTTVTFEDNTQANLYFCDNKTTFFDFYNLLDKALKKTRWDVITFQNSQLIHSEEFTFRDEYDGDREQRSNFLKYIFEACTKFLPALPAAHAVPAVSPATEHAQRDILLKGISDSLDALVPDVPAKPWHADPEFQLNLKNALFGYITRQVHRLLREARANIIIVDPTKIQAGVEVLTDIKVKAAEASTRYNNDYTNPGYLAEEKAWKLKTESNPGNALEKFIQVSEETAARYKKISVLMYANSALQPSSRDATSEAQAAESKVNQETVHLLIDKQITASVQYRRLAQLCQTLEQMDDAALSRYTDRAIKQAFERLQKHAKADKSGTMPDQTHFQNTVASFFDNKQPKSYWVDRYRQQTEEAKKTEENNQLLLMAHMPRKETDPLTLLSALLQPHHKLYQRLHAKRGLGKSTVIVGLEKLFKTVVEKQGCFEDLGPDFAPILPEQELLAAVKGKSASARVNYCASQHMSVLKCPGFNKALKTALENLLNQERARYKTELEKQPPTDPKELKLLHDKWSVLMTLKIPEHGVMNLLWSLLIPALPHSNVLWRRRNERDPQTPAIISALQDLQAVVDEPGRVTINEQDEFTILPSSKSQLKSLGASLSRTFGSKTVTQQERAELMAEVYEQAERLRY